MKLMLGCVIFMGAGYILFPSLIIYKCCGMISQRTGNVFQQINVLGLYQNDDFQLLVLNRKTVSESRPGRNGSEVDLKKLLALLQINGAILLDKEMLEEVANYERFGENVQSKTTSKRKLIISHIDEFKKLRRAFKDDSVRILISFGIYKEFIESLHTVSCFCLKFLLYRGRLEKIIY